MWVVHEAFGIVLVVVVVIAALVAVASWLAGPSAYDQIGRGGLSLRDGSERGVHEDPPAAAAAVRDEEIRQLIEARNARRVRQGKEPLDVEAEVSRRLRDLQSG